MMATGQMLRNARKHWPFLVIMPLLIIVMTYPTINHVFDTSRFWVPALDWDVWFKFWDAWHFKQVLAGQSDFYHTNMLFYPEGISLVYLTYNLPHMIVLNLLQLIMPPANAYCLAFLLIIFCCCFSGYIYCSWLFKDKWIALLGAVIFGLSQQVMGNAAQPDTGFIATIPLTLYFLHRGVADGRGKLLAMAGLMLGFTAWFGMYIFVCNALTVAAFVLLFAKSRWRERRFWAGLALMGALAFVLSAGRTLPILSDPADFDRAIQAPLSKEGGSDLIGFAFNYRHPVLSRLLHAVAGKEKAIEPDSFAYVHRGLQLAYVGLAAYALIGLGLLRKSSRRKMLPWLIIAAGFTLLRLGPMLSVNGIFYEDILLPKYYLDAILPMVFASFHRTSHFQIGVVLPVAILACYGLRAIFDRMPRRRRAPLVLGLVALIAYETYHLPYAMEIAPGSFDHARWLAVQEEAAPIRLVSLPMTDSPAYNPSDMHMLYQTVHGYPIVAADGAISRDPPAATNYIEANPMLAAARRDEGIICSASRRSEMLAALERLNADGYTHVVVDKGSRYAAPFLASFAAIETVYADRHAAIYALSQLRRTCDDPPAGTESLALYLELVYGDVMPPREEAIVTFHASARLNEDALRYLSWSDDFGRNLNHATVGDDGKLALQSTNSRVLGIDDLLAEDAFLLLRPSVESAAEDSVVWRDWLEGHFQFCQRIAENAHVVIDQYLRRDMPCELVLAASPMEALYDNGAELRNRVVQVDGGELRIALWWRLAEGAKTSYSIQVFDAAGARVRQTDHVMNRTMVSHTLDLSDLPAGEYQARLIVYDFESGKSHGGEIKASGARFGREIEIGRFAWSEISK